MHISEGVLSAPVLISGMLAAAAGTGIGFKKMDYDHIPRVGILSAAFFVASLIHVPVGPSSVHLVLNGVVGLLLGWAAFPAILVALILQAVFFQYGGITTLGVNTVIMALPAVVCYGLFSRLILRSSPLALAASFACGFLSVLMSAGLVAIALIFTREDFFKVSALIVTTNLPVMVIEGILTTFCVAFLKKVQPDMLPGRSLFLICLASFLLLAHPGEARAHKVNVFAWVEGDMVYTESKFGGGKEVKDGDITVFDAAGNRLLEGKTDENGLFSFKLPNTAKGLRIVLQAGMGHQGEWRLSDEDLGVVSREAAPPPPVEPESALSPKSEPAGSAAIDPKELERIVENALDKKLKPLFRLVAESRQEGPTLSEILGGIGYIIGLVGLGAYLRFRRLEPHRRGQGGQGGS